MLKLIMLKLQIMGAIASVYLYTKMCEDGKRKKLHIDYDVRGVAVVSAVDKLELNPDVKEVFFQNSTTTALGVNDTLYTRIGVTRQCDSFVNDVNMDSFRAVEHVNGEPIIYSREEYLASQPYKQDQFRVVFPNGRVITDKAEYEKWVGSNIDRRNAKNAPDCEEAALDETFALPA